MLNVFIKLRVLKHYLHEKGWSYKYGDSRLDDISQSHSVSASSRGCLGKNTCPGV